MVPGSDGGGQVAASSVAESSVHIFSPSTGEAEAGGYLSLRSEWSTEQAPGSQGYTEKEKRKSTSTHHLCLLKKKKFAGGGCVYFLLAYNIKSKSSETTFLWPSLHFLWCSLPTYYLGSLSCLQYTFLDLHSKSSDLY